MKMRRTELREVVVETRYICNRCAEPCVDDLGSGEVLSAEIVGGYGSSLGDMERYAFDLCEDCLLELFATFKIDPRVTECA